MKAFTKNFLFYFTYFFDAICFFLYFLSLALLIKINLYQGIINPEGLKFYKLKKLSNISNLENTSRNRSWDWLDENTSSNSHSKLQQIFNLKKNSNIANLNREQEKNWPGILYLDRG